MTMKKTLLALSVCLATMLHASEPTSLKQEGLTYIKQLGSTLKSQLQEHMKADPTGVAAMGFCSAKAMEITREVNGQLPDHARVRRTALKSRNTANLPDATDLQVMQEYVAAIEAKQFDPKQIKVVEQPSVTRVYKPLVMEAACLKCHGSNVSSQIQGIVASKYPKDQAIGLKEGEFRGVIVAEIMTKM
jgi:mono/diheme cytochrome c family protein